ncbi:MAG: START domain-containing protein [Chitinophagales bacterium]
MPLLTFAQSGGADDWQLRKDEKGIKVYSRHVDGHDIDQLKVVSVMHGSLSSIAAVIMDVNHYPDWIYSCKEGKLLKQVSPTEQYQYQRIGAPYPFSDRDAAIHFTISQDPTTKVISTRSVAVPDYVPENKDLVRLPVFDASYELTPLLNGDVQVVYMLQIDPGGYIPSWLVNATIISGPFESTVKMQKQIEKTEYQNRKLPFIQEP